MKQLRRELKLKLANQYLLEYRGETFSDKLKHKIEKHILEQRMNKINSLIPMSLVCVSDKKEIKSLGASIPNDLINDNFGRMLASMFRPEALGNAHLWTADDLGNVARSMRHGTNSNNGFNNSGQQFTQIGQSGTAPTRQDFNIGSPFTNLPESGLNAHSNGGWNSGLGQVKHSITINAGGAGTIAESVVIQAGEDGAGANRTWIWNRDLISPTASFLIGQQIFVEYTWQM